MSEKVAISIIIPVYNAAEFLPGVIDCLKAQTFSDFEAILVDDGSSDGGADIIRSAADADPRFRLVQQSNAGVSAARNRGLDVASGQWIVFMDSDDWLRPDALSVWMSGVAQGESGPDVVIANGFRFDGSPERIAEPDVLGDQPWGRRVSGADWIQHAVTRHSWKHYVWLQMVRRSFIDAHAMRFEVGLIHEDVLWTCHLALNAVCICFIDERIYGYRINPQSLTSSPGQDKLLARARGYVAVLDTLVQQANRHPQRAVGKALLQHAIVEAGHLMGLFRKRLSPSPAAVELAKTIESGNTLKVLIAAARHPGDWWRLTRLKTAVRSFSRRAQ